MAKWKVTPKTGANLSGVIDYDSHGASWGVQQDIQPFLDQAKEDRSEGDGKAHQTKLCTVPEVIAIEVKLKWGIDIFSPEFMHDKAMKAKFFSIIQQEYPLLMSTNKTL